MEQIAQKLQLQPYVPPPNLTLDDGWSLFEDRPGRPGYIATRPGATLSMRVRFGAARLL